MGQTPLNELVSWVFISNLLFLEVPHILRKDSWVPYLDIGKGC